MEGHSWYVEILRDALARPGHEPGVYLVREDTGHMVDVICRMAGDGPEPGLVTRALQLASKCGGRSYETIPVVEQAAHVTRCFANKRAYDSDPVDVTGWRRLTEAPFPQHAEQRATDGSEAP
jgi:hypothetical protein